MKRKFSSISLKDYCSGTELNSIILNDPLLKYLDLHHENFVKKFPQYAELVKNSLENTDTFTNFIMNKGNEFEKNVVNMIKHKFQKDFIDIEGVTLRVCEEEEFEEKYQKTLTALKYKVPILFSPVLIDHQEKLLGVPDIIMRGDFIKNIFKTIPSGISNDMYYIIDIKYTTLKLSADGVHLLNEGMNSCYKVQTFIYNKMLNNITGDVCSKTFILGRNFKYTCKGIEEKGDGCFDRLATIDFKIKDKEVENIFKESLKKLNFIKENNYDNSLIPFFPNMKNEYDYPWTDVKKEIAKEIGEITQLWMCSTKNRDVAISKGITSIYDPKIDVDVLGITGQYTKKILREILDINKSDDKNILNKFHLPPSKEKEIFIDFESINNSILEDFSGLPSSAKENYIFQIGIFYEGVYTSFVVDKLKDNDQEYKICDRFYHFVKETSPIRIYHFSNAEVGLWNNVADKYKKEEWLDILPYFTDLLKIIKDVPIVFKGAYDFSLKSIVGALNASKKIDTTYGSMSCACGTDAMFLAYKASQEMIPFDKTTIVRNIVDYNEIDCKSMYEILKYLRE